MVSVGLSVCLVLQTPSHLAGPLVVLGSGPGMQGMVQWTIRRKFPAAQRKLRNNSVMGNNWKKNERDDDKEWDGTGCLDRQRSRLTQRQ